MRLFEKAAEKGVSIQLPTDFVTAHSLDSVLADDGVEVDVEAQ